MDAEEILFTIEVETVPGGVRIAPEGELDVATQPELRASLEQHGTSGAVVLDLSGLAFVDTSGLRLILETAQTARDEGREFAVLPGIPAVQRLFEISGVIDLVPFRDGQVRGAP